MPAAIDKSSYVALTPRDDGIIHLYAINLNEEYQTTVTEFHISKTSWPNYILGVLDQFQLLGVKLCGFDLALTGDVPLGGGLSSSASVECAVAMALNKLFNTQFDKLKLAKMAQLAEHKYAGVKSGIMDQFASMFGKANNLIKLDCRSLEFEYIPFELKNIKIVLFDTNIKHKLASSEYNLRREQCLEGVEMISKHIPHVHSLRDVTIDMINQYVLPKDKLIYKRCQYVIEENARLISGCSDILNSDIESFGKKMFESHQGLTSLYEVSCPELDFLVNRVANNPKVLGARMMGGGFGGCTINLIKDDLLEDLVNEMKEVYLREMDIELLVYKVNIESGSEILK